jgi:NAD(P)-dependent dehydrogenase (short-subunit alcohol dehydrogenase family)
MPRGHRRLDDKVVIITGAAAGIGAAAARIFAQAGAAVVLSDIDEQGAARVIEDIHTPGGGGSLINTSSALAVGMQAGARHAYAAAKGGVLALTKSIAFDYAAQRVRANAIVPGFTQSERVARDVKSHPELTRKLSEQHPLGFGQPEGVAHLALYLASDESAQTTGQVFGVNNEIIR